MRAPPPTAPANAPSARVQNSGPVKPSGPPRSGQIRQYHHSASLSSRALLASEQRLMITGLPALSLLPGVSQRSARSVHRVICGEPRANSGGGGEEPRGG